MAKPAQLCGLFAALSIAIASPLLPAQQAKKPALKTDGKAIFAKSCAPCHTTPITGTKPLAELTKFIHKNMPPEGQKLTLEQAKAVSQHVWDSTYSPVAQERNRPPRRTLSRLTVKQFRNAVSDLLGPIWATAPTKSGGLKAEYFKGRHFTDKQLERVDPQIDFNFGTEPPAPDKFEHHTFSTLWTGSIYAPDTGEYDFIVRSDQATRMWINNQPQPFVDGWVRAKNDREFTGHVFLLGGRNYPVRLEFSKATQGVDDKKAEKPKTNAFVQLLWKRPKRTEENIPTRFLFSEWAPSTYIPHTQFPADDRSMGFERGAGVSKEWDEATTAAALEAASYASLNASSLANTKEDDPQRSEKIKQWAQEFVTRAFREPLNADTKRLYIDKQFQAAPNPDSAIKRVVLLTLKSPRFLYREPADQKTELAMALWDSIPDAHLLQAQQPNIREQAERMVNDRRTWNKLRDFLLFWLKVDETPDIVKHPKLNFDATTASDLRSSLELFLEDAAWNKANYQELFLSKNLFLNDRLTKIYSDEGRAGVLTHPYILAHFSYLENTSPIHRGVLIARSFLGRTLAPPPQAFTPLAPSLHPTLTTRERVVLQTKANPCNTCHDLINPLGFTLERFDAIGRLRDKDNNKPIDDMGAYQTRTGEKLQFKGPEALAQFLANSPEAKRAFVEKLFLNATKQPPKAYSPTLIEDLTEEFRKSQYNIKKLLVEIAVVAASPSSRTGGGGG